MNNNNTNIPLMYGSTYPDLSVDSSMQSGMDAFVQDDHMSGMDTSPIDGMAGTIRPQTLDQIISNNNKEMLRRRQNFQHNQFSGSTLSQPNRRVSMLEFSSNPNGDLADFQFDPNPATTSGTISNPATNMVRTSGGSLDLSKGRSRDDLTVDTRFPAQLAAFNANTINPYAASLMNSAVSLDGQVSFSPMPLNMNNDFDTNLAQLSMSTNHNVPTPMQASPISAHFSLQYPPTNYDPGGDASPANSGMVRLNQNPATSPLPPRYSLKQSASSLQARRSQMAGPSPLNISHQTSTGSSSSAMMQSPAMAQSQSRRPSTEIKPSPQNSNTLDGMHMDIDGMIPQMTGPIPPPSRYATAYSATGFDMLSILMRVATRSNPKINLGPVDLSCAFVVCDAQKHDMPIVYCSDMFERLTGYSRHEILHRNCRFLQAPDGKVQSGVKRKYVDDKAVLYLKNQINKRTEAQLSLINYRKGGQPFMNLLTMIPITWDTEEYRFYVGFQVDLVEQPGSVSARNPDGTYEINYNRSALPAYRLPAPDTSSALENMGGATISRDEVAQVLGTIGNGETEMSRRIWDKILLENSDDVIHVLSLKGLFLYLSPACKNILEYEPNELVGTPLSSVCHPSDIVPVTRELKDASSGAPVNVVYRIRRKNTGYTWFEAHGCLHTEQGKGRKCIILVGRQRPVYALNKRELATGESIGDAEMWSKMSTTGFFLYVSSTSRAMLDRLPDDLVGTSMQTLMRPDSKKEFGRVLELARMGEKSTFKHDMQNRRGQVLQAQTTIYPGDAKRGLKPTFLLAQTRLLKMTRAMLLNNKASQSLKPPDSAGGNTPHSAQTAPATVTNTSNSQVPGGELFTGNSGIMTQAGSGGVPIGSQDEALASEDNIFDELKTTRSTSWQFELRQMERTNRLLAEDLQALMSRKKKRKKRKGMNMEKDCANCHTRVTPEWRRGPSGQRDLCNSCGLRWAKQVSRTMVATAAQLTNVA